MGRTAFLTAIVLTAALNAGAAFAEPQPPRQGFQFPDFATMDANKDGKVTKEEFLAALPPEQRSIGERVFAARDANKDGVLTREESEGRGGR